MEFLPVEIDLSEEKEMSRELFDQLDRFLLFGETLDGKSVLAVIANKVWFLSRKEKAVLKEWQTEAFESVFEVLPVNNDEIRLRDLVSEAEYNIFSGDQKVISEAFNTAQAGDFVETSLVPIKGVWFLSGIQKRLSHKDEETIFREFVQKQLPRHQYRHNPEKLKVAFELQKKYYDCFVSVFGADELVVRGQDLPAIEKRFFEAWNEQEKFVKKIPGDFLPGWLTADEVGVLVDEKEGLQYVENYGKFKKIFFEFGDITEEQKELFEDYFLCEEIPAFVFRRMKDRYPEKFKWLVEKIVPRLEFKLDPIKDFDSLMDIYKPSWREIFPSIFPFNQRFKKYHFEQAGVGRNDPCPCESGSKFKKCCGK